MRLRRRVDRREKMSLICCRACFRYKAGAYLMIAHARGGEIQQIRIGARAVGCDKNGGKSAHDPVMMRFSCEELVNAR